MPIHDWTKVSAGTFHDFHTSWISELKKALNSGLLPVDYYVQSEQVASQTAPDVLTLQVGLGDDGAGASDSSGGTAVLTAPPEVSVVASLTEEDIHTLRRKQLIIRHTSGDRVVAYIEILSPGNKSGRAHFERFLNKAVSVLNAGCHLLVIDLFPPGKLHPEGIHGANWSQFTESNWKQPADKQLTLAAYTGGLLPQGFIEPIAVGDPLKAMPLFLDEELSHINVPLESTYAEAYASVPRRWREVIEGNKPAKASRRRRHRISWLAVSINPDVIRTTREDAWNARWFVISDVISLTMSTFDCSSTPCSRPPTSLPGTP